MSSNILKENIREINILIINIYLNNLTCPKHKYEYEGVPPNTESKVILPFVTNDEVF